MFISCAMYTKELKPLAFLNLNLQSGEADIVKCIYNTIKSVQHSPHCCRKSVMSGPWFSFMQEDTSQLEQTFTVRSGTSYTLARTQFIA